MRIAAVVESYPALFKSYYDAQFARLMDAGHDVRVFSTGRQGTTLNEKVVRYGLQERTTRYPTSLREVPASLGTVLKAVATSPGRTVRAMGAASRHGATWRARVTNAARAAVLSTEPADLYLVHSTSAAVRVPWLREAFPGVPVALYYHGGEVPTVEPLAGERVRSAFGVADAVFTNTTFSRDHAVGRGCPPDRVHILPMGFDLRDFDPAEDRPYRRGGILRLLSAGRMSEEKGFLFALQALRELVRERGLEDVHYALTGQGYVRPELEAFVEEHGLDEHVTFLGNVSTEELIRHQEAADVLLLPSIQVGNWVENQACAVQETMLMKGLVVVSRTGGVPESVAPEMRPFIVEEGDWMGLADAIERIHAMEPEEMALLGEAGRRFVLENYDVDAINRELIATTTDAARRRGSGVGAGRAPDAAESLHDGTRKGPAK